MRIPSQRASAPSRFDALKLLQRELPDFRDTESPISGTIPPTQLAGQISSQKFRNHIPQIPVIPVCRTPNINPKFPRNPPPKIP